MCDLFCKIEAAADQHLKRAEEGSLLTVKLDLSTHSAQVVSFDPWEVEEDRYGW